MQAKLIMLFLNNTQTTNDKKPDVEKSCIICSGFGRTKISASIKLEFLPIQI